MDPGSRWPASLAKTASFRFSDRPHLKEVRWRAIEENIDPSIGFRRSHARAPAQADAEHPDNTHSKESGVYGGRINVSHITFAL